MATKKQRNKKKSGRSATVRELWLNMNSFDLKRFNGGETTTR